METKEILNKAVDVLRSGGLLLYPTDTVWGLGCDATDPEAVAKIFALKKREDSKSLVLLASDLDMVARYIKEIPEMAVQLVEVNDQPMTIIYPGAIASMRPEAGEQPEKSRYLLAYNTVAADGTVGIRIPMMDFCVDLVRRFGCPIVSTSANISGGLYSGPCTGKYIHRQVIVHHQGRSGRHHRDHQKVAGEKPGPE